MPLQNLNHVNVRARDLQETADFYVEVLGLRDGERPPFAFPGKWIYLGDQAVIHLVEAAADENLKDYLGGPSSEGAGEVVDHIAFEATGLSSMVERLAARGIEPVHRKVPLLDLHQIFFFDPNGLKIELNYPAAEGNGFPPT